MPPGKFGSGTTADEAAQGIDLADKTALVTGGNSGIGVDTARVLAERGARVIITSRRPDAGEQVAATISSKGARGTVVVKQLDLADLKSVQSLAADINATEPRLDLLILNAGIMACPHSYTKQDFEMQMGTNHFGHFYLTELLTDKLKAQHGVKSSPAGVGQGLVTLRPQKGFKYALTSLNFLPAGRTAIFNALSRCALPHREGCRLRLQRLRQCEAFPSRIVVLSSAAIRWAPPGGIDLEDMHWRKKKYKRWQAYGQSKLANALFAAELAKRLKGHSVTAFSVHPGTIVATGLGQHLAPAIPGLKWIASKLVPGNKTSSQGAATTVWAAVTPGLEQHSGAYLEDCHVSISSKEARDPELAHKLWLSTEEQLKAALSKM